MKGVQIDFAGGRRISSVWWLLFLVCMSVLIALGADWRRQASSLQKLQGDLATLEHKAAETSPPQATPHEDKGTEARSALQIEAIEALNVPWPAILSALEKATPTEAALLRLEARSAQRALHITAEAQDAKLLYDLLATLQRDATFTAVRPMREELSESEHRRRVRLAMEAIWRP